ncbi:hypothetical protein [Cystobacter fuscus]|uniref:hypothetical protein n=1 Tax=Cystobacter fuscus TaxID=43 RepID=UPI000BB34C7C|nr:hypothetical protein [Cystobacter fuscus]
MTQQVLLDVPDAKLTQYIDQSSHPYVQQNGGVCSAMTLHWIDQSSQHSSPSEASAHFGKTLNNNINDIISDQQHIETEISSLSNKLNHAENYLDTVLTQEQQTINQKKKLAKEGKLSPEGLQDLEKHRQWFRSELAGVKQAMAETSAKQQELKSNLGAGLPHTNMANKEPLNPDTFGEHVAELIGGNNGFYRLSFNGAEGEHGHVVGLQVSHDTGEYKYMDPNTGEFRMNDPTDMLNVAILHANKLNYHKDYSSFSLDHYAH